MHILNGLGLEYNLVVVHVTSLVDNLSLESIQSLLLTHESRVERHYFVNDSNSNLSVNLSIHNSRSNNRNGFRPNFNQNRGYPPMNRSQDRAYPKNNTSIPRLLCQVCHKAGHTNVVCHYRFDKAFVTPKINDSKVFLAEIDDQEEHQAYSSSTLPEFVEDFDWYVDTGATNHIAQGMEHLESEIPCSASDTLAVGNGKRLVISHIGRVLLKGRLKNGLYMLSHSSFPSKVQLQCQLVTKQSKSDSTCPGSPETIQESVPTSNSYFSTYNMSTVNTVTPPLATSATSASPSVPTTDVQHTTTIPAIPVPVLTCLDPIPDHRTRVNDPIQQPHTDSHTTNPIHHTSTTNIHQMQTRV
uniref:Polyprotein n=1 Tax=Cannabis sativa TaxID=3483 RepID=A0A803NT44_CANSA